MSSHHNTPSLRLGHHVLRSPIGPCEVYIRPGARAEPYVKRIEKLFATRNAPAVAVRGSKGAIPTLIRVAEEFLRRNSLFVCEPLATYAVTLEDSITSSSSLRRALRSPLLEVIFRPPQLY